MLRWLKQVGSNPLVQVAGLALTLATLFDFQGTVSALIALYPAAKAIVPIVALVGAFVFGLMLITNLWRWRWNRRPAARFRRYHGRLANCRDKLVMRMQWGGATDFLPLVTTVLEVRQILIELEIETPSIATEDQDTFLQQWANFLGILVPLAEHSRLQEARAFAQRLQGSDQ